MATQTFQLIDGYNRSKTPKLVTVRPMTFAEALSLHYGDQVSVTDNAGQLRHCKVNGKVKTWKKDPTRFELPLKYGMYEFVRFSENDIHRLVVVVQKDQSTY